MPDHGQVAILRGDARALPLPDAREQRRPRLVGYVGPRRPRLTSGVGRTRRAKHDRHCTACGEGRRPVADRAVIFDKARDQEHATDIARRAVARTGGMSGGTARSTLNGATSRSITGYACGCPEPTAPTRPALVLDPFGGTGTTALAARALGRRAVSVAKPPPMVEQQLGLFEDETTNA